MTQEEKQLLEFPEKMCEYCCNFDKEHIGMDGTALCKLTMTLAYAENYGGNCMFYNVPQERIIVAQAKVGDIVWVYDFMWGLLPCKVVEPYHCVCGEDGGCSFHKYFSEYDIGKTVFLTKEEAEAALKERGGK